MPHPIPAENELTLLHGTGMHVQLWLIDLGVMRSPVARPVNGLVLGDTAISEFRQAHHTLTRGSATHCPSGTVQSMRDRALVRFLPAERSHKSTHCTAAANGPLS